ncbi:MULTISPECIES: P-type conjugative transfer protein TrbG [Kordiimonas]|jgi:type IV secretion system protein VirB9|uniref:P-type conjugative transfer protein TrbG n=1 Tax=Kordiimonas TaxID=288021 RepID=UPI0025804A02|nr:P-type conjugative transfer protein TrbG [Kordiimonas sp. UBA4487]
MRHTTASLLILIPLLSVTLSACAGKRIEEPLYDSEDFVPATREAALPRPIEIVSVPTPLPLPGQLKPLLATTVGAAPKPAGNPLVEADTVRGEALMEPDRDGYINARQVYPYMEGALYRLYTSPGQVSAIMLEVGEHLVSVSAGDTLRWVIGDTVSGTGVSTRVHILVKPVKVGLETNLIVISDRRSYHLELTSTEKTWMASLAWTYPQDELLALERRNKAAAETADVTVANGVSLDRLRFRYRIEGDSPPWRPLRAFDDTHKVYIQFPTRLDQGDAPPLFILGEDGKAALVNYRVRGRTYIVDRLFGAAELRFGEHPQQVVRIIREGRAE